MERVESVRVVTSVEAIHSHYIPVVFNERVAEWDLRTEKNQQ